MIYTRIGRSMIVNTRSGTVRGKVQCGAARFAGIPYAAPPVGERRFRAAAPAGSWSGVRNAEHFGPVSPQAQGGDEAGCLTLNIWAPQGAKRCPVLFFVHGGSFIYGSGSHALYDGTHLARTHGIVVVTFNYRLGPLGFLDFSHLDSRFEPNCGFTDMMEALRWVHENIEEFGGDPENITVAGQSAGAISASVFPMHRELRPLLSKVILASGSPTFVRSAKEHREVSGAFADAYLDGDPAKLLTMSAKDICRAGRHFQHACGLGEGTYMVECDGKIIEEQPVASASMGAAAGIPVLMGTVREEMSFACSKIFSKSMDVAEYIRSAFDREGMDVISRIRREYDAYGKRGESVFLADRVFRMGTVWFAQEYSRHAPCWLYRFDFEARAMRFLGLRAMHSTDLPLFFGNIRTTLFGLMYVLDCVKKSHYTLMNAIQSDLAQFMRSGTLPWEQCTSDLPMARIYDRKIREEPAMRENERKAFEESLFYKDTFRSVVRA